MFCSQCGNSVPTNSNFCSNCGTSLSSGNNRSDITQSSGNLPPFLRPDAEPQLTPPPLVTPPFQSNLSSPGNVPRRNTNNPVRKKPRVLELSQREKDDLIWEAGDYIEIVCGTVTFTSQREYKAAMYSQEWMQFGFFFESDSEWGTKEWYMSMARNISNGAAILLLYRRGNTVSPFAIVSVVDRGWQLLAPWESNDLIKNSSKHRSLLNIQKSSRIKGMASGLLVGMITGGIGTTMATEKGMKKGQDDYLKKCDQIEATGRALMFRIAKDIEKIWSDGDNSFSGRL